MAQSDPNLTLAGLASRNFRFGSKLDAHCFFLYCELILFNVFNRLLGPINILDELRAEVGCDRHDHRARSFIDCRYRRLRSSWETRLRYQPDLELGDTQGLRHFV
jgi:hypothetical protein